MNNSESEPLLRLFREYAGFEAQDCVLLPLSGSNRKYYRISGGGKCVIGVDGKDLKENEAFISLDRHFASKGLPVPQVYAVSEDSSAYLQEDLGTVMLSDLVAKAREDGDYGSLLPLLRDCIRLLARFQFEGGSGLDFSLCHQSADFDLRSVMFDLNYFKYCFLKPSGVEFDETALQDDFEALARDLVRCGEDCATFLYRDFQSRNVMIKDGSPYFIDFQGGRKGPIYYDLVSFVWQVRAAYPEDIKSDLVGTYLDAVRPCTVNMDEPLFFKRLRLFRLFRLMQVLGAYGFRGLYEHKAQFTTCVIPTVGILRDFILEPPEGYPYLVSLLRELTELPKYEEKTYDDGKSLEVKIYSFSYKKGIPEDFSGNGGGYVFDCRYIHNPGRYEQYRKLSGLDRPVIEFLEEDGEILRFLGNVEGMVVPHIGTYLKRGFTNLSVAFGCTGGQHRSVYCAERLAGRLAGLFPQVRIRLIHRERNIDRIL
ncbi:MAG: phosphotransferase, partial [Candidatus Cryptobacteroides sp.]